MTVEPQDHKPATPTTLDIDTRVGVATVIHPTRIPSGILRKARKFDAEVDQLFFFIEELSDEKTLAILDQLDMLELSEFFQTWMQGAPLGESVSSES